MIKSDFPNFKLKMVEKVEMPESIRNKEGVFEKTGKKIDRVGILHLKAKTRGEDKKGKSIQGKGWRLLEPTKPLEYYYGIWENSKSLFYFMNPNPTPKNLIYKTKFQKDERTEFDLPDEAAE